MDKMFLVRSYDDHGDAEYYLYKAVGRAVAKAREEVCCYQKHYEGMNCYSHDCDGTDGWWFREYGEERWDVYVKELEVQDETE